MKELLTCHMAALIIGICLDQVIGDPHCMPHPIRWIGNLIFFLEKRLLGDVTGNKDSRCIEQEGIDEGTDHQGSDRSRNYEKEKRRGILLWFAVVITVAAATFCIVYAAYSLNKYLGIAIESVLTCYILAARSLCRESMRVYRDLEKDDIAAARFSISMIVGRDTDNLDAEEIAKAAVETVAENTSDGVIAPLIYTAIGGPVLGFFYKAVNTMDSMLGYKNERYENFGFWAAKADDFFNYVPSRISALFMILGSFALGLFSKSYDGKKAYAIWKRDRYNHKSPNSAQTESVCAGALGLKLGGTHLYKGVLVEKPTIGDEIRRTEPDDIKRSNNLMFATEAITVVVVVLIFMIVRCF
ncbi:adenosylcobinamide-phosphate synthase CbiB [Butyrivibrio sp. VCB2006]|uniref:adenosylcobinamide-phosphate synthase CbiB n=1 Tax=Butyrivibrio sp. VCB2006 TaxID=1280679 RepID=UPI00049224FE|nr:adenosylcobinamide-phosphate synthase CbiB [Butyrivibrio sp. VCB2006]